MCMRCIHVYMCVSYAYVWVRVASVKAMKGPLHDDALPLMKRHLHRPQSLVCMEAYEERRRTCFHAP